MTSAIQRAELQAKIWKIANEVRGSVDGLSEVGLVFNSFVCFC